MKNKDLIEDIDEDIDSEYDDADDDEYDDEDYEAFLNAKEELDSLITSSKGNFVIDPILGEVKEEELQRIRQLQKVIDDMTEEYRAKGMTVYSSTVNTGTLRMKDLVKAVRMGTCLTVKESKQVINLLFSFILRSLFEGKVVAVKNFGEFSVVRSPVKKVHSFKYNRTFVAGAYPTVKFVVPKDLRRKMRAMYYKGTDTIVTPEMNFLGLETQEAVSKENERSKLQKNSSNEE